MRVEQYDDVTSRHWHMAAAAAAACLSHRRRIASAPKKTKADDQNLQRKNSSK
jgi:hypothetical protein